MSIVDRFERVVEGMSPEETKDLAVLAMGNLSSEDLMTVISQALSDLEREELASRWGFLQ